MQLSKKIEVVKETKLMRGLALSSACGRKVLSLRLKSRQISCYMQHLTTEQRYAIYLLLQSGHTQTFISEQIGVHKSTISREICRNSDHRGRGHYDRDLAIRKAAARQKDKPHYHKFTDEMKALVNTYLTQEEWSPEQISHRLRLEGIDIVSHETIYQYVYADKRRKGQLYLHLRHKGRKYQKRKSEYAYRGIIPGRVDVSERPAVVNGRGRFAVLPGRIIAQMLLVLAF